MVLCSSNIRKRGDSEVQAVTSLIWSIQFSVQSLSQFQQILCGSILLSIVKTFHSCGRSLQDEKSFSSTEVCVTPSSRRIPQNKTGIQGIDKHLWRCYVLDSEVMCIIPSSISFSSILVGLFERIWGVFNSYV